MAIQHIALSMDGYSMHDVDKNKNGFSQK